MNKPHKHSELIKAWANGAEIQIKRDGHAHWEDIDHPIWRTDAIYRIKPETKPDFVLYTSVHSADRFSALVNNAYMGPDPLSNLKIVFDGDTGKPKSAEVIK